MQGKGRDAVFRTCLQIQSPGLIDLCPRSMIERTEEKPSQVIVVNGGDARSDGIVQAWGDRAARCGVRLVKTVCKGVIGAGASGGVRG